MKTPPEFHPDFNARLPSPKSQFVEMAAQISGIPILSQLGAFLTQSAQQKTNERVTTFLNDLAAQLEAIEDDTARLEHTLKDENFHTLVYLAVDKIKNTASTARIESLRDAVINCYRSSRPHAEKEQLLTVLTSLTELEAIVLVTLHKISMSPDFNSKAGEEQTRVDDETGLKVAGRPAAFKIGDTFTEMGYAPSLVISAMERLASLGAFERSMGGVGKFSPSALACYFHNLQPLGIEMAKALMPHPISSIPS